MPVSLPRLEAQTHSEIGLSLGCWIPHLSYQACIRSWRSAAAAPHLGAAGAVGFVQTTTVVLVQRASPAGAAFVDEDAAVVALAVAAVAVAGGAAVAGTAAAQRVTARS